MEERRMFQWADYLVFSLTLLVSLAIGLYFGFSGDRQRSTSEYFMGNRKLHMIPVVLSILVTMVSGVGVVGIPAEVYSYGTLFSTVVFAQLLGNMFSAFFVVPLFYRLNITSVTEYPELRFKSKIVRYIFSVTSILTMVIVNAMQLYAPSIALAAVSEIPLNAAILVAGCAATLYTALGGIKAVIWTDSFQSIIIFGGLLLIVIQGTLQVGGLQKVWELNEQWGRIKFYDFDPDPTKRYTTFTVVFMNAFLWTMMSANQPIVQRYNSLSSLTKAKWAVIMNAPAYAVASILCSLSGIVAFAYYADKQCDPFEAHYMKSPNHILSYFVMDVMSYPGVPGVFIACVFSAALSTVSSCINSVAAFIYEDYLKDFLTDKSADFTAVVVKISVLVVGVCIMSVACLLQFFGGTVLQLLFSVAGSLLSPIVGVLLVGAIFAKINKYGITVIIILSTGFSMWLAAGANIQGTFVRPLPAPVQGCPVTVGHLNSSLEIQGNITMRENMVTFEDGQWISRDNSTVVTVENYHTFLHGLKRFYALSYLSYPFLSMMLSLTTGLLFSFIPIFQEKELTSKRYVFPCIGYTCNRHCGVMEEETEDQDLKVKLNDVNENHCDEKELRHEEGSELVSTV